MFSKFREFFWDKWLMPVYFIMFIVLCSVLYDCSGCSGNNDKDNSKEIQMQSIRENQIGSND